MDANLLSLFWEGFSVESFTTRAADALIIRLQPDLPDLAF
jgi:hypothetical protein